MGSSKISRANSINNNNNINNNNIKKQQRHQQQQHHHQQQQKPQKWPQEISDKLLLTTLNPNITSFQNYVKF